MDEGEKNPLKKRRAISKGGKRYQRSKKSCSASTKKEKEKAGASSREEGKLLEGAPGEKLSEGERKDSRKIDSQEKKKGQDKRSSLSGKT